MDDKNETNHPRFRVAPDADFQILPGIVANTFSTPHTPESLALRLNDEDSKLFVYTSDTGFSEDLVQFAKPAEARLLWSGETIEAKDGLRLEI